MMNRLGILNLLKNTLGEQEEVTIFIPRVFKLFGRKFRLGTKRVFKLTNLNIQAPGAGYGFANRSPSYAVIFNNQGVISDMMLFGFITQRVPEEFFDDFYDFIVAHLKEMEEFLSTRAIKGLEF